MAAIQDTAEIEGLEPETPSIRWEDIKTELTTKKSNSNKNKKVNVKRTKASDKDSVMESRLYYDTISGADATKTVVGVGVGNAVIAYVSDLVVKQVFMETIGAELAYAAGIGSSAGPIGIGIGVATVLASVGYSYWCNAAEQNKLNAKKSYNDKVKLFNSSLSEMKELETEILSKKKLLKTQEDKLNNKTFQLERHSLGNKSKVIVVGPTGYGKSLVCNRLSGNKEDIDDLLESKTTDFEVAQIGDTESQTRTINKISKKIYITENKQEDDFVLSVVDTPGAFDSSGNDTFFQNYMAEYFRSCGGVNIFCISYKFNCKADANYQKLLQLYEKFWGKDIWKHCVVIVTNCDRDSKKNANRVNKGLGKTIDQMKTFLKTVSNNLCKDVPIFEFGEENFEPSVKQIFSLLTAPKSAFNK